MTNITADDLVRREVHYCVSSLVSTLAHGAGYSPRKTGHAATDEAAAALYDLTEQAVELVSPIDDWEEAARESGWKPYPRVSGAWCRDGETGPNGEVDMIGVQSAREACEFDNLDPYQREVFEHWIVSDWLADKLAEKGEKVDKDFAGMIVWARTTTGQGIASDSVIEAIAADLNKRED